MTTAPKIISPKKLIEVALPLDDINKAAAREKSIRHGHPSTLHLWWARRPLAAARAVLFAQLVNDPSWKYSAEELEKPQVKAAVTRKRKELFKLITELVQWESTTNEEVLERARREIRASWRETCEANKDHPDAETLFNPDKLPAFHDPFAGGGAIPLEAQRLGLEAHATDLNPVAVLINKAMIEIPPKFAGRPPVGPVPKGEKQTKAKATEDWSGAKGLAEDVRRYGAWMREEAEKRIGHLYPKVKITTEMVAERPDLKPYEGQELTVIAWLWARTVRSPNPAFADVEVPLASTFVLATKKGKEAWVEPVAEGRGYRFTVKMGKTPPPGAKEGTKLTRGANFKCLMSSSPIAPEYIKAEGQAGRLGSRLMAVVAEGDRGRVYVAPSPEHELAAEHALPRWRPQTPLALDPRALWTPAYGLTTFGDLFTPRQLVALTTFSDLVQEARERVKHDALTAGMDDDGRGLDDDGCGAAAYADSIGLYLSFGVDRSADFWSSLCVWANQPKNELVAHLFGRQAIPMAWDFAEANPFSSSGGNFEKNLDYIRKGVLTLPATVNGKADQADATEGIIKHSAISTDPPYYDNIGYANLSDYFYVWLRRSIGAIIPNYFTTIATPKQTELVADPYRHGSRDAAEAFFLAGMKKAIHSISADSHPTTPATIYYAFKQAETNDGDTSSTGWETFLDAVLESGLSLIGTWPMRTERTTGLKGSTNMLASSIVLVCRPRPTDAPTVARKDFLRELDRALPAAIAEMTADPIASIAPVDLAQACIGPGMAIFSKYAAVLEADGSPMRVHDALVHINKAIDAYFAEAEGDLDADTRFCIGWFQQYGFEAGPFGEADVLARAKGTSVDGVQGSGVLEASKGKVRLLEVTDYPAGWDPTKDERVPIWEACHQMCRALSDSEHAAGALLARMPEKQDAIRQLAYRLYTLCERKGWAAQARAYNELVTSWPAIVEESQKVGHRGTQMAMELV